MRAKTGTPPGKAALRRMIEFGNQIVSTIATPGFDAQAGAAMGADAITCVEIERCIGALFDAQARRRIADAYLTGWIVGDDAMNLLIDLQLIEVSND